MPRLPCPSRLVSELRPSGQSRSIWDWRNCTSSGRTAPTTAQRRARGRGRRWAGMLLREAVAWEQRHDSTECRMPLGWRIERSERSMCLCFIVPLTRTGLRSSILAEGLPKVHQRREQGPSHRAGLRVRGGAIPFAFRSSAGASAGLRLHSLSICVAMMPFPSLTGQQRQLQIPRRLFHLKGSCRIIRCISSTLTGRTRRCELAAKELPERMAGLCGGEGCCGGGGGTTAVCASTECMLLGSCFWRGGLSAHFSLNRARSGVLCVSAARSSRTSASLPGSSRTSLPPLATAASTVRLGPALCDSSFLRLHLPFARDRALCLVWT